MIFKMVLDESRINKILQEDRDFKVVINCLNRLIDNKSRKTFYIREIYEEVLNVNYDISKNNLKLKINMLVEYGLLKIYMKKYGFAISEELRKKLFMF